MKLSPVQGAIKTVRLLLSNSLKMSQNLDPGQASMPPLSGLFPNGQDTFLPPLINDGVSILPPFNPIGPYNPNPGSGGIPQNQNDVPDDIRELLG